MKRVYGPRSEEERRRISEGLRAVERRTGRLSRTARERFEDPERKERLRAAMMKGYYEKNAPSKISARAKQRCADLQAAYQPSKDRCGVSLQSLWPGWSSEKLLPLIGACEARPYKKRSEEAYAVHEVWGTRT
ncbi:unnamed protein product [Closterium sp. Naga37s-1]|nr:unnamed protein product [Closterium sp. Naga37s-1]